MRCDPHGVRLLRAADGVDRRIQTFAVPALGMIYRAPLVLATGALTVYLFGNASGVLTGGFLADRATRHDLVAAGGVLCSATLMVVLASAPCRSAPSAWSWP